MIKINGKRIDMASFESISKSLVDSKNVFFTSLFNILDHNSDDNIDIGDVAYAIDVFIQEDQKNNKDTNIDLDELSKSVDVLAQEKSIKTENIPKNILEEFFNFIFHKIYTDNADAQENSDDFQEYGIEEMLSSYTEDEKIFIRECAGIRGDGNPLSEEDIADFVQLSKQYGTNEIMNMMSLKTGLDNQFLNNRTIIELLKLPKDKQEVALNYFKQINISNFNSLYDTEQIVHIISVQEALPPDILTSNDRLKYGYYDNATGNVIMQDANDENTYYIYNPDYKDGPIEMFSKDQENKKIKITNYLLHIEQEVDYITHERELTPLERILHSSKKTKTSEVFNQETIRYYDDNKCLQKTITRSESCISGVQNIVETDKDGNIINEPQKVEIDENGNICITKNFCSPEGVKTNYSYKQSQDASYHESSYLIVDNKGKKLLERTQRYQKISENEYLHTINGKSYKVNWDENNVVITNLTNNNVTTINLNNIVKDKNPIIMSILKKTPADRLFALSKYQISIEYGSKSPSQINNASFWVDTMIIGERTNDIDSTYQTLFSTFMHEFGHFLDESVRSDFICKKQEIIDVFNEEYKLFCKETTNYQQDYVKYFTKKEAERSSTERVAETNMLLTTIPKEETASRALYFQQYFPRTIAKIAEALEERLA